MHIKSFGRSDNNMYHDFLPPEGGVVMSCQITHTQLSNIATAHIYSSRRKLFSLHILSTYTMYHTNTMYNT